MSERKLPVKTDRIALEGEWVGWEITARVNPRLRVFGDIASGDFDRMIKGLADIIISWNFVDEEGLEMPPPTSVTVGELPYDLAIAVANAYTSRLAKLPPA